MCRLHKLLIAGLFRFSLPGFMSCHEGCAVLIYWTRVSHTRTLREALNPIDSALIPIPRPTLVFVREKYIPADYKCIPCCEGHEIMCSSIVIGYGRSFTVCWCSKQTLHAYHNSHHTVLTNQTRARGRFFGSLGLGFKWRCSKCIVS
jgi:hypothetical protein